MNPRIQELLDRSTRDILGVKQVDYKEFAESIVEECADIAKHHVMNISTYSDADFVDEQIKQHFGVGE